VGLFVRFGAGPVRLVTNEITAAPNPALVRRRTPLSSSVRTQPMPSSLVSQVLGSNYWRPRRCLAPGCSCPVGSSRPPQPVPTSRLRSRPWSVPADAARELRPPTTDSPPSGWHALLSRPQGSRRLGRPHFTPCGATPHAPRTARNAPLTSARGRGPPRVRAIALGGGTSWCERAVRERRGPRRAITPYRLA